MVLKAVLLASEGIRYCYTLESTLGIYHFAAKWSRETALTSLSVLCIAASCIVNNLM